ncbi:unnamed protein product [Meloidogyne enterolobii]|uniref:Uncharacterized protein n=1 Tax=Meloidogyne enterolobii TaxID=390850 RepID=A0ACB0Y0J8_MELEN
MLPNIKQLKLLNLLNKNNYFCWPSIIFKIFIFCLLIIPEDLAAHFFHDDYFDFKDPNRTYRPKYYWLTLSIRNHNVSEAIFFRLLGVDNTVDFHISPGQIFTNSQ